ncbi:allantoate amidohydrolase [Labrys wisconsinensis]|uniref:Allantoate deiminase n=1 Tax=Labrys wisconsinensis TaxID=425677 RepID=A0ABU0J4T0_9HYPH|nr:allantoate amidohydrolase [Labrys wisconsinensis]MDQ0469272.1 allantoate deiminase [Labrys wisconsinensis]
MTAGPILDIEALGRRAEAMIRALAAISAEEGRITRLYLTPEHRRAADLVASWMQAAGLVVSEDALGTVRGRLPAEAERQGANGARRLLLGSHIDTVIDAGAYDGNLGVVAGILAAEHIARSRGAMPFGIDVLAFGDEEGSRFPATLLCSGAVAGHFDPGALAVESVDGITLEAALRAYGGDPGAIAQAACDPAEAAAYVEVHIEQGPVLEAEGEALGVVTAIAGQTRLSVTVVGEAGHAGTVPMALRRDALAASAEIMGLVEAIGRDNAADFTVATVGKLTLSPGASNVIPARVVFTVDLRSQTDTVREAALTRLRDGVEAIAARRRVTAWMERVHEVGATACDAGLQAGLGAAIEAGGGRALRLASGAGHDGQAMGRLCPIAMLFVRCRGGVSHNPAEFVSTADMGRAVAALIRFVEGFGG